MKLTRTILLLDDDNQFRGTLAELLQSEDFHILEASDVQEAEQILEDKWVHMAVVDLSMTGADDDRSGMIIVDNPKFASIPKAILTGYGDDNALMRETLKGNLVLDFIDKREKDHDNQLVELFAQNVKINWDLRIRWESSDLRSLLTLLALIAPHEKPANLPDRINELEDLLRKVFINCRQITMGRLLAYNNGVAWIEVSFQDENEMSDQCLVACGVKENTNHQIEQCRKFIPQTARTGCVRHSETAETLRFSAVTYETIGGDLVNTMPFSELYLHRSQDEVIAVLNTLFSSNIVDWHKESTSNVDIDRLESLYRSWKGNSEEPIDEELWNTKLEGLSGDLSRTNELLEVRYSEEEIIFYISEDSSISCPNPIKFLLTSDITLDATMPKGTIHGHLHPSDILVDTQEGTTWLIDYAAVEVGLLLRDYISLESALLAELLKTVSLDIWCQLVQQLLSAESLELTPEIGGLTSEAEKLLSMIGFIRKRAVMLSQQNIDGYVAGMQVYAVHQLANYNEESSYNHRDVYVYLPHLMIAGLSCEQLLPPPPGPREFSVDFENKVVTVEGRCVKKMPKLAWQILQYLHENVGQLCTYENILRDIWEDHEDDITNSAWMLEYGRPKVNARFSVLRKTLEPNPKDPRYIMLIRDHGYALEV